jgi:hypothetical protein
MERRDDLYPQGCQRRVVLMKPLESENRTFWQNIFANAKINGGRYDGDDLPEYKWNWPSDTWLQERRAKSIGVTENEPPGIAK